MLLQLVVATEMRSKLASAIAWIRFIRPDNKPAGLDCQARTGSNTFARALRLAGVSSPTAIEIYFTSPRPSTSICWSPFHHHVIGDVIQSFV